MKLVITGSHGVGKTTLLDELKKDDDFKDYLFSGEIARNLVNEGYAQGTLMFQQVYTDRQLQNIKSFYKEKDIIWDRWLFDILVYSKYIYSIKSSYKLKKNIEHIYTMIKREYKSNLKVCFIPIEFDLTDDSVRDEINFTFQKDIQRLLLKTLNELDIRYTTVGGHHNDRVSKIKEIVS